MMKTFPSLLVVVALSAVLAGCSTSHTERRAMAYQEMGQMQGRVEQLDAIRAGNAAIDARDQAKIQRQMNREDRLEEMQDREQELAFELKELEAKLAKTKINRMTEEEIERTKTAREKVHLELEQQRAQIEATKHPQQSITILH